MRRLERPVLVVNDDVLRALADDGALTGFQDVKVVVTP